jgi:hypothetical protein
MSELQVDLTWPPDGYAGPPALDLYSKEYSPRLGSNDEDSCLRPNSGDLEVASTQIKSSHRHRGLWSSSNVRGRRSGFPSNSARSG